jgi:hypothetical protein
MPGGAVRFELGCDPDHAVPSRSRPEHAALIPGTVSGVEADMDRARTLMISGRSADVGAVVQARLP